MKIIRTENREIKSVGIDHTKLIDDYCEEWYGHRNWEYSLISDNNEDIKYIAKVPLSEFHIFHNNIYDSIGIFKEPHNEDGDCLCKEQICAGESYK